MIMAVLNDGRTAAAQAAVDANTKSLRANIVPRSFNNYSVANITGTIAAALGANSAVFAMRNDPGAGARIAHIERLKLQFTAIVAFTVPLTAGRRLALFRGSGAAATGGTAIATAVRHDSTNGSASEFDTVNGGDMRIATTGALTVTGITFDADPLAVAMLVHVGAAGAHYEMTWEFPNPLTLQPGQLLALRVPQAMDAAGTWQLSVNVEWYEASAFNGTTEA